MLEKFDNFFGDYIKVAQNGSNVISTSLVNILDCIQNIFLAVFAVLVMVVAFPLWLIGMGRPNTASTPTGGNSPASEILPTGEVAPSNQVEPTPPTSG